MSYGDLPLVSDLLNDYKYTQPFTPDTSKFTPDNRLLCWEKTVKERRKLHQKYGKKLERRPGELVMNSAEEEIQKNMKKLLIEYTRIESPDKYRGCPSDLKVPPGLKEIGDRPALYAVLKQAERCKVPEIEHVGIPHGILAEKGILEGLRLSYTFIIQDEIMRILFNRRSGEKFDNLPYYQTKLDTLKLQLNKINPHNPNFENLIVTGAGFSKKHGNFVLNPPRFSLNKQPTLKRSSDAQDLAVLSLELNGVPLQPFSKINRTRKIFVFYEYDVTSTAVAIQDLRLENKGTVAIRYYWKDTTRFKFFRDILPERTLNSYFHFDKNDGIILPGAIKTVPVYFRQKQSGVYAESWEFYTRPACVPNGAIVLVIFHANAIVANLKEQLDVISTRLDHNVRSTLISESLDKVLQNVPYDKREPTIYKYDRKQIFEAVNTKFDPLQRHTKFEYEERIIDELEAFYQEVKQLHDPPIWNLRIDELRLMARNMEQRELFEQRIKEKHGHMQVLFESVSKSQLQKIDEPEEEVVKEVRKSARPSALHLKMRKWTDELNAILLKLKEATVVPHNEFEKYEEVYQILTTYFNRIEDEIDEYKERMGIAYSPPPAKLKKTKLPKDPATFPDRFPYEELPETIQGPQMVAPFGSRDDKPASELLKEIPVEDFTARINAYFGKAPATASAKGAKGGKGDKKGDKKSDKKAPADKGGKDKGGSKSPGSKSGGSKSPASPPPEEELYFDPYAPLEGLDAEEEVDIADVADEIEGTTCNLEPAIKFQYLHNVYVIFYNNLGNAVTCIENALKMRTPLQLPIADVKAIEDNTYLNRLVSLKDILMQDRRERIKHKLILKKVQGLAKKDWRLEELKRKLLKQTASDSSLWSVLREPKSEESFLSTKPISYPEGHTQEWKQGDGSLFPTDEIEETAEKITATSDSPIDPNWTPKYAYTQKDFDPEDPARNEDLVGYIERLMYETSMHNLSDYEDRGEEEEDDDEEGIFMKESADSFYDISSEVEVEGVEESEEAEENKEETKDWVEQRISEVIKECEAIRRGSRGSLKNTTFNDLPNNPVAINFIH